MALCGYRPNSFSVPLPTTLQLQLRERRPFPSRPFPSKQRGWCSFPAPPSRDYTICALFLALGAVVAAAAGDYDAFNGRLADQARLIFAAVDAVLELEESFFAIGVYVVGHGGTA